MRAHLLACGLIVWALTLGACGQTPDETASDAGNPLMEIYYVMDEQAQMPVYAIRGPVGWTLESEVQWNLDNNVVPAVLGASLTDPQETKRLQFFPDLTCYWLTGDAALNNPGQMNMGMLNVAPMEPKAALVEAVTRIYQPDVPGFQITGVREVPGLPAALGQTGPNFTGVGLRAVFPWEGQQMEEEIYAVHGISSATMRGEAGVTTQTTWGLSSVHAFITQEGSLDSHRSMFTYMVRSGTPNPAWVDLHMGVKQHLDAQFQQNLVDNRRAREAIMAQSRALAVQNDAFRANIMQRHRAAMDTTAHKSFIAGIHSGGSPSSSGMSGQDKFIDSIHDRETFQDSSTVTGTSQHGYADHHWSDGWGNYIHTDNPNVDPNIGSTIEWQQLQRVE
ncbi:MAG: hypothetical protein GY937_19250 [bacterium]|nr:hypothetical protein [bacterium]